MQEASFSGHSPSHSSIRPILGHSLTLMPDRYKQIMLWAAYCLCFFAFMHSGKFTLPPGVSFDPSRHLFPSDVTVDSVNQPSIVCVHLKASKTDTTGAGIDIFISRTYNSLCPVVAMLRYLAVRGFSLGPLFCWQDGSPLTRPAFVDNLCTFLQQAGVDPSHHSGHSFRIGAVTTAAANGLSDATIR